MKNWQGFIIERWQTHKVMTLKELVQLMNCSEITARRRLKKLRSITSCNKNGRYYTLASIAEFDDAGLWFHKGICFSENGTLIQTLIELVCTSVGGLCGGDLNELLCMDTYSILSRMMKGSSLRREKIFGKFFYFSPDEVVYEQQLHTREEMNKEHFAKVVSDALGVIVLVEFIQNPGLNLQDISRRLNRKGAKITESLLHDFLCYHGLLKKL